MCSQMTLALLVLIAQGCARTQVVLRETLPRALIEEERAQQLPISVRVAGASGSGGTSANLDAERLLQDLRETALFREVSSSTDTNEVDLIIDVSLSGGVIRSGTPFHFGSRIMNLYLLPAEAEYRYVYDFQMKSRATGRGLRIARTYRGVYRELGLLSRAKKASSEAGRIDLLRHDLLAVRREILCLLER
jgi:hypothetical protein